jgi:hypothetical protein
MNIDGELRLVPDEAGASQQTRQSGIWRLVGFTASIRRYGSGDQQRERPRSCATLRQTEVIELTKTVGDWQAEQPLIDAFLKTPPGEHKIGGSRRQSSPNEKSGGKYHMAKITLAKPRRLRSGTVSRLALREPKPGDHAIIQRIEK